MENLRHKITRFGLYLVLVGIPLVPPGTKDLFAGAAVLVLGLVRVPDLIRGRLEGMGAGADLALLAFLVWSLFSSAIVSDLPEQSIRAFSLLALHVALFYVALNASTRDLALAPTFGGVLAALIGILQYYEIGLHRSPTFGSRITSTFANPNHLSSYLGVCLPVLLCLSVAEERGRVRLFMYAGVLLIYTSLLMAGTRGVIVGLGAGGAMCIWALLKSGWRSRVLGRWREGIGLILSMGLVTFLYSFPNPVNRGTEASGRIASSVEILRAPEARDAHILHRWLIWSVTARMVRSHPFLGVGYGNFACKYAQAEEDFLSEPENERRFRFPVRPPPASYAHNDYLQVLAETGLIGLALFFAFLSAACARAVRSFRLSGHKEEPLRLGVAGGLVSVLVHGLVSYPLHMPATSFLFWALLGWLVGCAWERGR